jgi:hypothetical protein
MAERRGGLVRTFVLTAILAGGAGCIFVTDTCACVIAVPPGVVLGTVTNAVGTGAAGADVSARVSYAPCSPTSTELNRLQAVSDGTGKFTLQVFTGGLATCVTIVARLQGSEGTVETVLDPANGARPDTNVVTVRLAP